MKELKDETVHREEGKEDERIKKEMRTGERKQMC